MNSFRVSEKTFNNREIVDFHKNKFLLISINLLGIILTIPFYLVFFYVYCILFDTTISDPLYFIRTYIESSNYQDFIFITLLIFITIMHEAIHGIFFYLFTGEKPVIGFKSIYPYAGSPNWYIKKENYLVIALSPLIVITLIGFVVMSLIPTGISFLVFLSITINAAGSVGDFWLSIKLLNKPPETYVIDRGTVSSINY